MREGVAGLLHDNTRKPGLPPLPPALVTVAALCRGVDDDGQDHLLQVGAVVVLTAASVAHGARR